MTDQRDKAQAYNTAVAAIGYAGILTIFSLTHDFLSIRVRATVGLLLVISLAFFVGWVIADVVAGILRARGRGATFSRFMETFWIAVLCLTIVPAVLAACILGIFYAIDILKG